MGLEGSRIEIVPGYSLIDSDGNREEIDIYIPKGRGQVSKIPQSINILKPAGASAGIQVWDFEFSIPEGSRMVKKEGPFQSSGRNYESFVSQSQHFHF